MKVMKVIDSESGVLQLRHRQSTCALQKPQVDASDVWSSVQPAQHGSTSTVVQLHTSFIIDQYHLMIDDPVIIYTDHIWLMTQRSIMSLTSTDHRTVMFHGQIQRPSHPDLKNQVRCLGRHVQDADVCELFTGQLQLRGQTGRAELEALDAWISRDNIRSDGYHMEIV